MARKKIKKKPSKKSNKKVARKAPQKSKIKGAQKKKTTRVKAPKKVKVQKKVKILKKVKIPKKVTPKKAETQKSVTKVLISRKSEEQRKSALRSALIKRREEIVKEAKAEISKYIRGETKQLVDTALDNGDWSVVDLSEDINLKQLGTHRETLLKIDEALRKLGEGTYGKCEDCGEDISVERLKVLPFAICCIDCQEKREQLEKLEREERRIE